MFDIRVVLQGRRELRWPGSGLYYGKDRIARWRGRKLQEGFGPNALDGYLSRAKGRGCFCGVNVEVLA